ncbi:hypothetical protein CAEBREN_22062 [Caenorhabditis brenneri]|uniref:Uncharacterized protein n=1 Tax=Caenorhabditis brenneri TaxID=135651 RepID=G0MBE6_CAEBE|nr:hypothetical protein CAEBREN_22062 [Caenorhabditis brenneri]
MERSAETRRLVTLKEVRHARGKIANLKLIVTKITTFQPEFEACLSTLINSLYDIVSFKDAPYTEERRQKLDTGYRYLRKLEDIVIRVIIRHEDLGTILMQQAAMATSDKSTPPSSE